VQLKRQLGPLPVAMNQQKSFVASARVLHITGLFNAPWRQEAVRSTGLLRTVVTRVMRQVNRSSTLNVRQRACADLIRRHVLQSRLAW